MVNDMAIYDGNGNQLYQAYDGNGNELTHAYDGNGNIIFSKEAVNLTVMSFNVGCFYTQYFPCPNDRMQEFYDRHQTIFDKYKPDFCGMPEWYKYIGSIESDTLMSVFWNSYIANYEAYLGTQKPNNAITFASKYALENPSIVQYVNQQGETRYYQKAYITVNNKQICVVNTHLSTGSIRNAQFVELLSALEHEPYFIATGDFNFTIKAIGDAEYNLSVQLALDRGFHSAQNSEHIFMTGYGGETPEASASINEVNALDNIITSANIDITNVSVDTTKLTDGLCTKYGIIIDHLPLIAELEIN